MRAVGAASSGHVSVTGSARPVPTLMCSFFFCSFPANGVRSQRWMRASSGPRARGAPSAGPRGPDHVRRRRAPYAVPRFPAVLRPCGGALPAALLRVLRSPRSPKCSPSAGARRCCSRTRARGVQRRSWGRAKTRRSPRCRTRPLQRCRACAAGTALSRVRASLL